MPNRPNEDYARIHGQYAEETKPNAEPDYRRAYQMRVNEKMFELENAFRSKHPFRDLPRDQIRSEAIAYAERILNKLLRER